MNVSPSSRWEDIGQHLLVTRPDSPSCISTGERFLELLAESRMILRDAYRPQVNPLQTRPSQLQFLFVQELPPAPPIPSDDEDVGQPTTDADPAGEGFEPGIGHAVQGDDVSEGLGMSTVPGTTAPAPAGPTWEVPTPFGVRTFVRNHKEPQTRSMPERRILELASCVPEPRSGWFHGINKAMLSSAVGAHRLCCLHKHFHALPDITMPVRALWASLHFWDQRLPTEALYIFTDGSFCPSTGIASWAVVVTALQNARVVRVGVLAGKVRQPLNRGAYDGEAEALLHARAIAFASCPVPAFIGSDCASALAATHAACALHENDAVVRGAAGLAFISASHGQSVQCLKVEAHAGCLFNEAADNIAKAIARSGHDFDLHARDECLYLAAAEGLLERAWVLGTDKSLQTQLPFCAEDGAWLQASILPPPTTRPVAFASFGHQPVQPVQTACLPFKLLQYNCLSQKGDLAKELLRRGLERLGISVAGLQETRLATTGIARVGSFWVLHAPCDDTGVGGCQLWLTASGIGKGGEALCWDRESFAIRYAKPQLLICTAQLGDLHFVLVSAHAPIGAATARCRTLFWQEVSQELNKVPQHFVPLVFIDANAHFEAHAEHPTFEETLPVGANAVALQGFCTRHSLVPSAQFDHEGNPLFSWRSPRGEYSLIDYVLVPAEWERHLSACTVTTLNDLHAGKDHFPILAACDVKLNLQHAPRAPRIQAKQLETEEGRQAVQEAFRTAPIIPWNVDSTTHVHLLHSHFRDFMTQHLPPPPPGPRHPAFSEHTFQLVQQSRHCRSVVRHLRERVRKATLQAVFQALRCHSAGQPTQHHAAAFLPKAFCALRRNLMRWQGKQYAYEWSQRLNAQFDKAEFLRRQMQTARDTGTAAFAHQIRSILRTGRKFKPPPLLPALVTDQGICHSSSEVKAALGAFFALAERGQKVTVEPFLAEAACTHVHPCSSYDGAAVPSIVELSAAFGQLARGKAPGLSGLPADLFRMAPQASAVAIWPIVAKALTSGRHPLQWTGGLAHSIPKGTKDPTSCASWRSIMLLEADAKAVQRAFRPKLLQAFCHGRPFDQYGGVPGCPLTLPAFLARSHFAALRARGESGGVLFLDCTAAYYSVAREVLVTPSSTSTPAWLMARANQLFQDPTERQAFLRRLDEGPILGKEHVPPELRRYVEGLFAQSWFTTDRAGETLWQTHSGTSPGSPIADTLFGILFSPFLCSLQKALSDAGLSAFVCRQAKECAGSERADVSSSPTWADDVAVLFSAPSAAATPQALKEVVRLAEELVQGIGLRFNYGPGKTEAVLAMRGPGALLARKQLFSLECPHVQVDAPSGRSVKVRVVESYVHLGTLLKADCHEYPNLKRRYALMQEVWQPLRRKVLTNPYVTVAEKLRLISERVFTKYLFGSGLWRLETAHEQRTALEPLTQVLRGALRPILGISQQGYNTEQAAAMLGLPLPKELLLAEQARALLEATAISEVQVWKAATPNGVWLRQAREALAETARASKTTSVDPVFVREADLASLLQVLRERRQSLGNQIRRFLRYAVESRAEFGRGLREAHSPDVQYVPQRTVTACDDPDHGWMCGICGAVQSTPRLHALHKWQHHGIRSEASTVTFGTRCEVCCTEFWDRSRLREHLKQQARCRVVYVQSDITAQAQGALPRHQHAWRPAVQVEGPRPFWAHLTPMGGG